MPEALRVGGVQTFTSLDFPGRHAAVVFCQGCPLRCVYCHNPDLIPASGTSPLSWTDIRNLLEEREGLLDGVVFSGGEPLAQKALPAAIREVRSMGYSAALHTSGALPERFSAVLPELDWVGFDLKAPFGDYEALTGVPGAGERVRRAYASLLRSGVEHEIRTTVWPGQLGSPEIRRIAASIDPRFTKHFVLQEARHPRDGRPMGGEALLDAGLLASLEQRFAHVSVRRASG